MKYFVFLFGLIVLAFAGMASAEQVSVNFCVDADMDEICDQEFTSFVELYGLTDMKLLEMALEDELTVSDWDEYLWAVSIEGYAYDYLPQFDGATPVTVDDGDEVYIYFTGWQWHSPGSAPSVSSAAPGMAPSGGSPGSGSGSGGSGSSSGSGNGSGASMPGSIPSGSAQVTAVSSWLTGYSVEVDGLQIGVEGTGSDVPDGIYTFYVAGNQQHDIKVNHPQFWMSWQDFFMAGRSYTANIDVPGRVVLSG
jgi:hypothetical protein